VRLGGTTVQAMDGEVCQLMAKHLSQLADAALDNVRSNLDDVEGEKAARFGASQPRVRTNLSAQRPTSQPPRQLAPFALFLGCFDKMAI
jgi:hypothetical protein